MSKKKGGFSSKSLKKASESEKQTINEYQQIQNPKNVFDEQEAQEEAEEDFKNKNYFEQKTSVPVFQQQKSFQPMFQEESKKGPSN